MALFRRVIRQNALISSFSVDLPWLFSLIFSNSSALALQTKPI
jgi:hypothetical protein